MSVKAWVPNIITLGNLACGVIAIKVLFDWPGKLGAPTVAALMLAAMVCDFLDGLVARALKVTSPLGKQLDSLADMVTFGVLPGMMVVQAIRSGLERMDSANGLDESLAWYLEYLPYVGFAIPLFSALRLAKFNIDTRQTDKFLGLATPANALFFLSLYLIQALDQPNEYLRGPFSNFWQLTIDHHWSWFWVGWMVHPFYLAGIALLFSVLLVTELPLIAFKFKGYGLKENWPKYVLLGICVALLAVLGYRAGPFVLSVYFVLSFIDAKRKSA